MSPPAIAGDIINLKKTFHDSKLDHLIHGMVYLGYGLVFTKNDGNIKARYKIQRLSKTLRIYRLNEDDLTHHHEVHVEGSLDRSTHLPMPKSQQTPEPTVARRTSLNALYFALVDRKSFWFSFSLLQSAKPMMNFSALILSISLFSLSCFAYDDIEKITVWDHKNRVTRSYNESQVNHEPPTSFWGYVSPGDVIKIYPKAKADSIYTFFSPCHEGAQMRQGETPINEFKTVAYPVKFTKNAHYATIEVDQSWAKCKASIYISLDPSTFRSGNLVIFSVPE